LPTDQDGSRHEKNQQREHRDGTKIHGNPSPHLT
jgi:hypothetical protein